MLTWQNYEEIMRARGLGNHIESARSHLVECVFLDLHPLANSTEVSVGSSRFGGLPDLPAGAQWPTKSPSTHGLLYKMKSALRLAPDQPIPLQFVAQLNLAELPRNPVTAILPDHGILYFFYDSHAYSSDQAHGVLYFDGHTGDLPMDDEIEVPYKVGKQRHFPLASVNYYMGLSRDPEIAYEDLMGDQPAEEFYGMFAEETPGFQMLGYPDPIQTPEMAVECELIHRGISGDDYSAGFNDPDIREVAKDWKLLLQVDSINGMMWGDGGMLYYWIREQDLNARRFDKVCCLLESS